MLVKVINLVVVVLFAGIVKSISKYLLDQSLPLGRSKVTEDSHDPLESELVSEAPADVPTFRETFVGFM